MYLQICTTTVHVYILFSMLCDGWHGNKPTLPCCLMLLLLEKECAHLIIKVSRQKNGSSSKTSRIQKGFCTQSERVFSHLFNLPQPPLWENQAALEAQANLQ